MPRDCAEDQCTKCCAKQSNCVKKLAMVLEFITWDLGEHTKLIKR